MRRSELRSFFYNVLKSTISETKTIMKLSICTEYKVECKFQKILYKKAQFFMHQLFLSQKKAVSLL